MLQSPKDILVVKRAVLNEYKTHFERGMGGCSNGILESYWGKINCGSIRRNRYFVIKKIGYYEDQWQLFSTLKENLLCRVIWFFLNLLGDSLFFVLNLHQVCFSLVYCTFLQCLWVSSYGVFCYMQGYRNISASERWVECLTIIFFSCREISVYFLWSKRPPTEL